MSEKKPSMAPFWGLVIVTGLPFILALYLFLHPEMLEVLGTKNHGQLIQPTRDLPALHLQTLDGRGLDLASLKGNWTLLMVADGKCGEACQQNLYYLRQIRRAMGENRTRVERLMVLDDDTPGADLQTTPPAKFPWKPRGMRCFRWHFASGSAAMFRASRIAT